MNVTVFGKPMYSDNEGRCLSPKTNKELVNMNHLTNHILINRYTSNNFGEPNAKVIEMRYDTPKRINAAKMDFVVKSGNRCSVSLSMGTITGMAELTRDFINSQKPAELVNQVSNSDEMKAMFRAGLRIYDGERTLPLSKSLEALVARGSILMRK